MLRVVAESACNDKTCPQILEDPDMPDDAYVQGWDDVPTHIMAEAAPPAGERIVRVPRGHIIKAGQRFAEDHLFATARTLFRLETLPQYLAPAEDERFRAFLEGQPLPERTPATSPWLKQISEGTAAGQQWQRVHIVQEPLSDYLRFELTTAVENVAAGERVYVADRALHPWMKGLTQDFWGFDLDDAEHATAMLMRYDRQGRFEDSEISTDPDIIRRCRRRRDMVLTRAIPVADYLDQIGLQPAKVG